MVEGTKGLRDEGDGGQGLFAIAYCLVPIRRL